MKLPIQIARRDGNDGVSSSESSGDGDGDESSSVSSDDTVYT